MLDHFDLALNQDFKQITVDQLLDGVRIVRQELSKALESHKLKTVEPEVGEEFDPNCHQAVMRQPTDEQEPNTIASVLQVGYGIDDLVLRPATVVVAVALESEEVVEADDESNQDGPGGEQEAEE